MNDNESRGKWRKFRLSLVKAKNPQEFAKIADMTGYDMTNALSVGFPGSGLCMMQNQVLHIIVHAKGRSQSLFFLNTITRTHTDTHERKRRGKEGGMEGGCACVCVHARAHE